MRDTFRNSKIRLARRAKHLSLVDVGDPLGIPIVTLSKYEHGEGEMSPVVEARILAFIETLEARHDRR